jgi:hypothetical protein
MSDENIVTHEHLATIEKYMAQQAESISKLADSINDLVIAERERTIRDERKDERLESLEKFVDKYEDAIKTTEWILSMFRNYIMRIGFPFVITALVILIIASTFDFSALTQAGK